VKYGCDGPRLWFAFLIRPLFSTTQKVIRHQAATTAASTCYSCCKYLLLLRLLLVGGKFERPQDSRVIISTIYRNKNIIALFPVEHSMLGRTSRVRLSCFVKRSGVSTADHLLTVFRQHHVNLIYDNNDGVVLYHGETTRRCMSRLLVENSGCQ
jgi:hypothetical protein